MLFGTKAPERNRTADLSTTNAVLYQLSYKSVHKCVRKIYLIERFMSSKNLRESKKKAVHFKGSPLMVFSFYL